MKIRSGFVSNSSSSSFIFNKEDLTKTQIAMLKDAVEVAKKYSPIETYDEGWTITETENEISGRTGMDNFDMREFMHEIGIDVEWASWGDGYF